MDTDAQLVRARIREHGALGKPSRLAARPVELRRRRGVRAKPDPDGEPRIDLDGGLAAEPVQGELSGKVRLTLALAVQQDGAVRFGQQEVVEVHALRGQQCRVEGAVTFEPVEIVGDHVLQELARVRAGDPGDHPVRKRAPVKLGSVVVGHAMSVY